MRETDGRVGEKIALQPRNAAGLIGEGAVGTRGMNYWHNTDGSEQRLLYLNAGFLTAVNAWRAQNGRAAVSESALATNEYNRFDVRASKAISLGNRRLELIAQVFNLFGRDNLGGIAQGWIENALSNSFGQILTVQPRQQAELALRFTF